jgi:hypothetical protein
VEASQRIPDGVRSPLQRQASPDDGLSPLELVEREVDAGAMKNREGSFDPLSLEKGRQVALLATCVPQ